MASRLARGIITGALIAAIGISSFVGCKASSIDAVVENTPTIVTETMQVSETTIQTEETTTPETVKQNYFDNIDERIKYAVSDGMFPEDWYNEPINAKAESLNPKEIETSKNIILDALKKSPEEVLINNLLETHVLSYLEFYGFEYGGTNSTDTVYLENKEGTDAIWLESAFHHEFSSILLRNYKSSFKEEAWQEINPKTFKYLGNGAEAIKKGLTSKAIDPELNAIGFLYQYAQSSLENDLNSFAENIFVNNPLFWQAIDKYPKLNEKFDLTVDFYHSINPEYTEEYFRKIASE